MLKQITPVILTYNEEPNIERCLDKLKWAADIVVVDSFSEDGTVEALRAYSQVRCYQRRFDFHAAQWNFAIQQTEIKTDWVLALDADYILTEELVQELEDLETVCAGYHLTFRYCVDGKPLRGSLYPPVVALFNRNVASYQQDGHTQRVEVRGELGYLDNHAFHDDRKPIDHWWRAQHKYMELEAVHLMSTPWGALGSADKLRRLVLVAPLVVFLYCLLYKKGILDGKAGMIYAIQRTAAELLLSSKLLRHIANR